jgi:hypothetical protein
MSIKYNSIIPTGSGGSGTWNGGTVTNEIIADGVITTTDLTVTGTLNASNISGSFSNNVSLNGNTLWLGNNLSDAFLTTSRLFVNGGDPFGPLTAYAEINGLGYIYLNGDEFNNIEINASTDSFLKIQNENGFIRLSPSEGLRFPDGTIQTSANTGSGNLPITGGTMTGNLTLDVNTTLEVKGSDNWDTKIYDGYVEGWRKDPNDVPFLSYQLSVDGNSAAFQNYSDDDGSHWNATQICGANVYLYTYENVFSSTLTNQKLEIKDDGAIISRLTKDSLRFEDGTTDITIDATGVKFPNPYFNSGLFRGSFDSGRNSYNGISLVCTQGIELNWQAGYLKALNGSSVVPIRVEDSSIVITTPDVNNNNEPPTPFTKSLTIDGGGLHIAYNDGGNDNWFNLGTGGINFGQTDNPCSFSQNGIGAGQNNENWWSVNTDGVFIGRQDDDGVGLSKSVGLRFGDGSIQTTSGITIDPNEGGINFQATNTYGGFRVYFPHDDGDGEYNVIGQLNTYGFNFVSEGNPNGDYQYGWDNNGLKFVDGSIQTTSALPLAGGTVSGSVTIDSGSNFTVTGNDGNIFSTDYNNNSVKIGLGTTPVDISTDWIKVENSDGHMLFGRNYDGADNLGIRFANNTFQNTAYAPTTQTASVPYALYDQEIVVTINGVTYAMLARIVT